MSKSNYSPNMSTRSNALPINKCSSTENVCKPKDDRVRNNTKYKQRIDNSVPPNCSSSGSYFRQYSNGKGQCSSCNSKQPRSRGGWSNKKTKMTTEQQGVSGGKKVNLNHLLNFSYETDDVYRQGQRRTFPRSRRGTRTVMYNKEQFIQANCQLIVKEGIDYDVYSQDVDLSMDWDLVEKVNIWREEVPSCPICLSEVYAARITKCGHMYCWPCILHYLALDDKTWRKCPICHEAVHKADLKSVSVYKDRNLAVQEVVTMQLMKRFKDSTVALPAHVNLTKDCYKFNDNTDSWEQRNMKFLVAGADQVLENIIEVERKQLEFKLATESDELEQTFIKAALELLSIRETALLESAKGNQMISDAASCEDKNSKADLISNNINNSNDSSPVVDSLMSPVSEDKTSSLMLASSNVAEEEEDDFGGDKEHSEDEMYYFYQSNDGQHVYLHPINVRCLLHQYGSFGNCPPQFSAKIIEMEEHIMSETSRKRYRYLSHLSSSLEFRIAEVDLRPPILAMTTLTTFREALDRRVALRRKKARDEKRVLRKAQTEALRKQGKYPSANICLESQQQFPQIRESSSSASFSVLLSSPGTTPGNESYMTSPSTSSSSIASSVDDTASGCPGSSVSFAQMLRSASTDEQSSWARRTQVRPSTSGLSFSDAVEDDDEDYAPPPNYQSSFGDALSTALDNLAPLTDKNGSGKRSKKGKKGKKVLLFSTSSQHH